MKPLDEQDLATLGGEPFRWFTDADIQAEVGETCSHCSEPIGDEVGLRLFRERGDDVDQARFHWACAVVLMDTGVIRMRPI